LSLFLKEQEREVRKGFRKLIYGGGRVRSLCKQSFFVGFFVEEPGGGGKCPEEEHTTCSGGPTINCHKRGLWGERNYKIIYFIIRRKSNIL
jgi:hypothetical protein